MTIEDRRALSFLQEQVLIAVSEGRCLGHDMRQVRGLVMRGLVEMVDVRVDDGVVIALPRVTKAGSNVAAELIATAAKRERRRRMERSGIRFVVSGGRR